MKHTFFLKSIFFVVICKILTIHCFGQQQLFEPATFWQLYLQKGHDHGSDESNRKTRGALFIEDVERWSIQNKYIPPRIMLPKSALRIATYNVRYWTNSLDQPTALNILEVIKAIDADVILLQEALFDAEVIENIGGIQIQELINQLKKMGYYYGGQDVAFSQIWAPSFKKYGTVIFSKIPLKEVVCVRFNDSIGVESKQGYVRALIEKDSGLFVVYATHLAAESTTNPMWSAELVRCEQLRQIVADIAYHEFENVCIAADCNAVRKIDFNSIASDGSLWDLASDEYVGYVGIPRKTEALDVLADAAFKNSFDLLGWRTPLVTTWSGIPVDHIFFSCGWNLPVLGSYAYFSSASDHCPIICDINMTNTRVKI